MAQAFGAKLDEQFEDKFLPSYNPHRLMTEDEIMAEFTKLQRMTGAG